MPNGRGYGNPAGVSRCNSPCSARASTPTIEQTNAYEQQKYADIIRVLGDRHVTRGLEVGCAEGLFTESLAALCEELVAVDISEIDVPQTRFNRGDAPVDLAPLGSAWWAWSAPTGRTDA
ncbi:hypothetical protein PSA01_39060 [Pseudonocardia saturnea]|uniref:Class I SAM-dependent methyltransferase n=1 Tax=Pseudonocardia saturnea TaxID=33909 RepID=A0ABQ0S1U9_9PSEU|nr:hypothetical protein Pdca_71160 [Pseudonocardia autotrophica]GEC26877.1 hypothetical protein PSA01_39060 [Pseudonocardia saturnea]